MRLSSPTMYFTTLGKRVPFPPCSEESTLCAVTQLARSAASPANCARLPVLHSLSLLNRSQDLMAQGEPQSTTSTWPSASSVASVKRPVPSTLLLKVLTLSTRHSFTRSFFTIRKSWSRTVTSGSHSLQESWKSRQELAEEAIWVKYTPRRDLQALDHCFTCH